ncbi:hypothetical protein PENSOL_c004G01758 [Penicillium solitum]|uniref:F-box domain-containing protein n=1 Tax=Penicillium solitum TaxID=60172 RepID=A0A1V6RIR2_9EURO|nr:uncharacterized protein PENSOL_c004G01758 [Penicillium solitum]OQE01486.1 hypothetical protein PENSOL_c004G01758 [Penicillium solitum]
MTYTSLPGLPFELWASISLYLSNADIKPYRLACNQFNNAAHLRIDPVFLSANPLNIEVFRGIASHDKFRHRVTEIIWDDARLARGPRQTWDNFEGHELLSDEDEPGNSREWGKECPFYARECLIERHQYEEEDGCPMWFKEACLAQPSLKECWQHYQHLLRQQKDVLADNSDLDAFTYGIKQFPALKRVTITPAAHGYISIRSAVPDPNDPRFP